MGRGKTGEERDSLGANAFLIRRALTYRLGEAT